MTVIETAKRFIDVILGSKSCTYLYFDFVGDFGGEDGPVFCLGPLPPPRTLFFSAAAAAAVFSLLFDSSLDFFNLAVASFSRSVTLALKDLKFVKEVSKS